MRLLHYANKGRVKTQGGWVFPEWFSVPQAQLMADLNIKDKHTLYRIRDELATAGWVIFENSKGREPPRYRLTVSEKEQPQKAVQTTQAVRNSGSFDTFDFWTAAVKSSFGEDFDMGLVEKNRR